MYPRTRLVCDFAQLFNRVERSAVDVANEQIFLLFQLVNGIEDQLAFEHSPDIDQDILINECANTIISMLHQKSANGAVSDVHIEHER